MENDSKKEFLKGAKETSTRSKDWSLLISLSLYFTVAFFVMELFFRRISIGVLGKLSEIYPSLALGFVLLAAPMIIALAVSFKDFFKKKISGELIYKADVLRLILAWISGQIIAILLTFIFLIPFSGEGGSAVMAVPSITAGSIIIQIFLLVPLIIISVANLSKGFILPMALIPLICFFLYLIMPAFSPIRSCDSGDRVCIGKLALKENNAGLCDYFSEGRKPNYCYTEEIYIKIPDKKICEPIKNKETKEDCYCNLTGICNAERGVFLFFHNLSWFYGKGSGQSIPYIRSQQGFLEDPVIKNKLDEMVKGWQKEKGRKIEYAIYKTDKHAVFKIRFDSANYFYCSDGISSGIGMTGESEKTVDIKDDNFYKKAFCSGNDYLTGGINGQRISF